VLAELNDKNADIENIAGQALKDDGLLAELRDGLKSKAETYRYNCYKVLYSVSQTHGEVLYPYWDRFAEALGSDNSYHKMAAVHLLANLTAVDKENRFEKIFDTYYRLLDDKSMVVAYYVASVSGKIIKAKPSLEKTITSRLLNIDKTSHKTGRKELIKSGVIEAFNEYFEGYNDKAKVINFVKQQLNSESSKTRKTAKAFLAKWDKS
jgi:HEAT repeat protein